MSSSDINSNISCNNLCHKHISVIVPLHLLSTADVIFLQQLLTAFTFTYPEQKEKDVADWFLKMSFLSLLFLLSSCFHIHCLQMSRRNPCCYDQVIFDVLSRTNKWICLYCICAKSFSTSGIISSHCVCQNVSVGLWMISESSSWCYWRFSLYCILQYAYQPDRRSVPVGIPVQTITNQSLQGKSVSPPESISAFRGLEWHLGMSHFDSTCLLICVWLDFFERASFHNTAFPYPPVSLFLSFMKESLDTDSGRTLTHVHKC